MPARTHPAGPVFLPCLALLSAALIGPNVSAQTYGGGGPFTATVEVRVPADAELWFDGTAMAQTGDRRAFTTPALNPRRQHFPQAFRRLGHAGGVVSQAPRRTESRAHGCEQRAQFLFGQRRSDGKLRARS